MQGGIAGRPAELQRVMPDIDKFVAVGWPRSVHGSESRECRLLVYDLLE